MYAKGRNGKGGENGGGFDGKAVTGLLLAALVGFGRRIACERPALPDRVGLNQAEFRIGRLWLKDSPERGSEKAGGAASKAIQGIPRIPGRLGMERRRGTRYPLRLRMCIVAVDNEAVSIPAYTANISRTGVLFQCLRDIDVGHDLEYLIDLYPDCSVQLRGKGKVVRWATAAAIPRRNGAYFAAVTIDRFECVRDPVMQAIGRAAQCV
jgi:hypothetical protein